MSAVSIMPPLQAVGSWYVSASAEEKKSVFTGKGMLDYLYIVNNSASVRYVWIYDNTAASGTQLHAPLVLPATSGFVCLDVRSGIAFGTGIYVASSSTLTTYTASSASDLQITCHYTQRV